MSKKPLTYRRRQPFANLIGLIIAMIAVGTAYVGIHEKLNQHSTKIRINDTDRPKYRFA